MTDLEKQEIDKYLDDKCLGHLKSKTLYRQQYQKIIDIVELPCWKDERFAHLISSAIFVSSSSNIANVLALSYWDDPKNLQFLDSTVLVINYKSLISRIELYKELLLGNYITSKCLRKTPEQIIALYKYLIRHGMEPIIDGKLHPLFNIGPDRLLRYYGINLKWLVEMERESKHGLS